MVIYGKEIDFKISRLKDAGNFELALQNMDKSEKEISKSKGRITEVITQGIKMFRDFFKDATGVDVLEKCEDFNEAKEAYACFLNEVKKQKDSVLQFTVDDIK